MLLLFVEILVGPTLSMFSQQRASEHTSAARLRAKQLASLASLSHATANVLAAFKRAHDRMEAAATTASILFGEKLKLL